ncbi:hypothetical protein [Alkalihalobacillus sp. 1P02AB]|uniref:hypothetical protein n=1 Tax=Alkalihalobacillus sp. 1P02AB TaxID=3132260 RepID=UPI0039A77B12
MLMNLEELILDCLEKHPGASSNTVTRFVDKEQNINIDQFKPIIFKKMRILKKDRRILNKGNSWYLMRRK